MAIVLTNPINVPNITRVVLVRPPRFHEGHAIVDLEVRSAAGGGRIQAVELVVRDSPGRSDVLALNPAPARFDDTLLLKRDPVDPTVNNDGIVDALEAAYRTGATKAAALRAVEQALLARNVVQLVGAVA